MLEMVVDDKDALIRFLSQFCEQIGDIVSNYYAPGFEDLMSINYYIFLLLMKPKVSSLSELDCKSHSHLGTDDMVMPPWIWDPKSNVWLSN